MNRTLIPALFAALLLAGCGKTEEAKRGPPPALVTVAQAQLRSMQVGEEVVGAVDPTTVPTVSAEVPGRVLQVLADVGDPVKAGQVLAILDDQDISNSERAARSEVKRLEALAANQQRLTERYRELVKKNFISPLKMDETESQLTAQREQLAGAEAQLANASRRLAKTRIVAPISGRVEQRMVSKGDYVDIGKPVFQLAAVENLRVRLPFPETLVNRIRPGLTIILTTPTAPDKAVRGRVEEIRPLIGASNRAFEAVVGIANPGDWKPGASVNGRVIIEEHPNAVVVPETSVVLRPAGKVVYVIKDRQALQRVVQTGVKQDGHIEILSGLAAGETIAVDGAGFLTDKAPVNVQNGRSAGKPAEQTK